MTQMTKADMGDVSEYIMFIVGGQEFCTEVTFVREIRGWTPVTPLPHAPSFVRGVINLRGAVLPIVDLSERLGFDPTVPTARHVIIVVQVGKQIIGLLVDAVSDIITHSAADIQTTPEVASEATKSFIRGVIAINNRMVSLLTLPSVVPANQGLAA